MKTKFINLLVVGHESASLTAATKKLSRNKKHIITKLPTMDRIIRNMRKRKILEDFVVFAEYDALICICNPENAEDMSEFLTYISYLNTKCIIYSVSENINRSTLKFHNKIIEDIFPVFSLHKNLKKQVELLNDRANSSLKIKYPEKIEFELQSLINLINNSDLKNLNLNFIAHKLIENDLHFINRLEKVKNIELKTDKEISELVSKIKNTSDPIGFSEIHNKCLTLTSEYLCGKFFEECFQKLF